MLELQEVERARNKVMRRRKILDDAITELNEAMDRAMNQARTKLISRKLKIVDIAELLDVSPRTITRWGASECRSYAEIHSWVKVNRQDLLNRLEKNYQMYLKEEGK